MNTQAFIQVCLLKGGRQTHSLNVTKASEDGNRDGHRTVLVDHKQQRKKTNQGELTECASCSCMKAENNLIDGKLISTVYAQT